jgi:hypothetical protein
MSFTPVTDITNFSPVQAMLGEQVVLTATAVSETPPTPPTNSEIEWSVISPSGGAHIQTETNGGDKKTFMTPLVPTSQLKLRATIRNGRQQ